MKNNNLDFQEQIEAAFSIRPDVNGILHGNQRRVLRGAPNRIVSSFKSAKSSGSLLLESEPERAAAISLESSKVVARYITQSFLITLSAKNFVIPDFLIERIDGSHLIIEVKPSIKGLSEENRQRYQLCKNLLSREGIEFRIIDSYMLPTKYEFQKLKMFYLRGHQSVWSTDVMEMATEILRDIRPKKIHDGRLALKSEGLPAELCDHLVFHKRWSFIDAANNIVEIAA